MGPTLRRLSHFPKLFSSFVDTSFCSQGAGGKDGARDWARHRLSSASHIFCSPLVKFQDKITKINAWPYTLDRIKICVSQVPQPTLRSGLGDGTPPEGIIFFGGL